MNQSDKSNSVYPELEKLLESFTIAVLKEQPPNLAVYAARYFSRHAKQKRIEDSKARTSRDIEEVSSEDSNSDEDYDSLDDDIMSDKQSKMMLMRVSDAPRMTIVGERFDPSEIDSEEFEKTRKIFPKTPQQLAKIREILKSIFLFNSLDEDQMRKVIESMFYIEVMADDEIIIENAPGDNFYLIDRGVFMAYNKAKTICEKYHNEGFFGELALLYNAPRKASIKAKTNGALWAIDRTSFRQLILKSAYEKRKRQEHLLQKVNILHHLSEYDRSNLADALKPREFNNEEIVREGEVGDRMYFIEDGEVMVTRATQVGEEELQRLHTGDYFGEVAIIAKIPRIATVHAVGTVKVAELDIDSYNRLMAPCLEDMRDNFSQYKPQLEKILTAQQMNDLFPVDEKVMSK